VPGGWRSGHWRTGGRVRLRGVPGRPGRAAVLPCMAQGGATARGSRGRGGGRRPAAGVWTAGAERYWRMAMASGGPVDVGGAVPACGLPVRLCLVLVVVPWWSGVVAWSLVGGGCWC